MTTEYWVEYLIFFSESDTKQLKSRNISEARQLFPKSAFAFRLYDVVVKEGTLEDGEKIIKRQKQNESGTYYPGGVIFNLQEIKCLGSNYSTLAHNMESNNWKHVVKTCKGNFQPFDGAKDWVG